MTQQKAVQKSEEQQQSTSSSSTPLMWPFIGGIPLTKFTTEGYFTCAFPTVFPTGEGDFLGQQGCQSRSGWSGDGRTTFLSIVPIYKRNITWNEQLVTLARSR